MIRYFIFILSVSPLFSQNYNYSLEDVNPNSDSYNKDVGPSYFSGNITISYFGHQY